MLESGWWGGGGWGGVWGGGGEGGGVCCVGWGGGLWRASVGLSTSSRKVHLLSLFTELSFFPSFHPLATQLSSYGKMSEVASDLSTICALVRNMKF